jgi:uncharacterized protein (TIGR02284 family)
VENDPVKLLDSLIKLDTDAVSAYQSAINELGADPQSQQKLREFMGDHERHIRDLTSEVAKLGATPAKATPDLKGFFLKGFTAIRSAMGVEQALKAMQTNEELTNRNYHDALQNPVLPASARAVVQRNYEDEQRHLRWINERIARKAAAPA